MLICIYLYRFNRKIVVDYQVYKDSLTCIFQSRRPPLAQKGAPIPRDAEFAITCKKVVLWGRQNMATHLQEVTYFPDPDGTTTI